MTSTFRIPRGLTFLALSHRSHGTKPATSRSEWSQAFFLQSLGALRVELRPDLFDNGLRTAHELEVDGNAAFVHSLVEKPDLAFESVSINSGRIAFESPLPFRPRGRSADRGRTGSAGPMPGPQNVASASGTPDPTPGRLHPNAWGRASLADFPAEQLNCSNRGSGHP